MMFYNKLYNKLALIGIFNPAVTKVFTIIYGLMNSRNCLSKQLLWNKSFLSTNLLLKFISILLICVFCPIDTALNMERDNNYNQFKLDNDAIKGSLDEAFNQRLEAFINGASRQQLNDILNQTTDRVAPATEIAQSEQFNRILNIILAIVGIGAFIYLMYKYGHLILEGFNNLLSNLSLEHFREFVKNRVREAMQDPVKQEKILNYLRGTPSA